MNKNVKACVVYESMFGNTEQIAEAVARGLGHCPTYDVARTTPDLSDVELVVLGGPTHAFGMTRESTRAGAVEQGAEPERATRGLREWLKSEPESEAYAVAVFDTVVHTPVPLPSAAAKIGKQARRHHLGRLVGSRSFVVLGTKGPPASGELAHAEAWAASLVPLVDQVRSRSREAGQRA